MHPVKFNTLIEPFKIKVVEPIQLTTPEHREKVLRAAAFNLFHIRSEDVLIDLLTDSGTGAMSSEQWAGIMRADEAYAGARSFFRFQHKLREITGFDHILPTHQGRASERILFELVGRPGRVVPNNAHFDTTRANVEHSGAEAVDLPSPEASDPGSRHPFKGNMDLAALDQLIQRVGPERIPIVIMTVTNNSQGGQPVSLENLRGVRRSAAAIGYPSFWMLVALRKTPGSSRVANQGKQTVLCGTLSVRCSIWQMAPRSPPRKTAWSTSVVCCSCATRRCSKRPKTC